MAFFELNSDVEIGAFRFSGVHELRIKRGIHGYEETATIQLPSVALTQKGKRAQGGMKILPGTREEHVTKQLLNPNDRVTIRLAYNEEYTEEFRGFVKRISGDDPVTVECEGYARQMRQNISLTGSLPPTKVETLLEMAAGICDEKGKKYAEPKTDIKVTCDIDWEVAGMILNGCDGTKVLDHIKECSDKTLSVFFIKPDELWCGLVYTPYLSGTKVFDLPTVQYTLGRNLPRENGLRVIEPTENVQVIINGQLASGERVMTESKNKSAKRKHRFLLNNFHSAGTLRDIAQEKEHRMNYTGYEGEVTGFLQPFVAPGYSVKLVNPADPEMNGLYLAESVETTFGVNGARRRCELGVKIS